MTRVMASTTITMQPYCESFQSEPGRTLTLLCWQLEVRSARDLRTDDRLACQCGRMMPKASEISYLPEGLRRPILGFGRVTSLNGKNVVAVVRIRVLVHWV